ncbi:MAG: HypC/HybG/HupF family hydrogenase formation chaperone [Pseudomonadota bacterium]
MATVNVDGAQMPVSLALLEDVSPGDFVVVHVGYALSKIDERLAAEQLAMMKSADKEVGAL